MPTLVGIFCGLVAFYLLLLTPVIVLSEVNRKVKITFVVIDMTFAVLAFALIVVDNIMPISIIKH